MRKAFRILYLMVGIVVAILGAISGGFETVKESINGQDIFPEQLTEVIAFTIWILVWPLVVIISIIAIIYDYFN